MGKRLLLSSDIIESLAWRELLSKGSAAAMHVYLMIFFKQHRARVSGKKSKKLEYAVINGKELTCPYIEAEKKYGITQPRLTRAIDELLSKGFITIAHQGGARKHDMTKYALSENYLQWKTGEVLGKRIDDSVERGFRRPKRTPKPIKNVSQKVFAKCKKVQS
jgi:hypothetical protein